jgi:hypothetical protein
MWFCARAIFYFQLLEGDQDSYLVHENIYLVQAGDPAAARVGAEAIARANEDTSEDGHLEVNERKGRLPANDATVLGRRWRLRPMRCAQY